MSLLVTFRQERKCSLQSNTLNVHRLWFDDTDDLLPTPSSVFSNSPKMTTILFEYCFAGHSSTYYFTIKRISG